MANSTLPSMTRCATSPAVQGGEDVNAVKKHRNIKNSALALRSLCDLAMRALEDDSREGEKA
ncbi:MAG: hypothetical protein IPK54_10350 [Dokdonella sp.]|uniref:hypothetical protein n=1 Tax=Dokdonella sp. TaxID=2291710 RepID=UPI0025C02A3A|nr:hypothetical protein [Dokdonella sp.]MBK8123933.1 hypothetical protein [Dokdonella sp.]